MTVHSLRLIQRRPGVGLAAIDGEQKDGWQRQKERRSRTHTGHNYKHTHAIRPELKVTNRLALAVDPKNTVV